MKWMNLFLELTRLAETQKGKFLAIIEGIDKELLSAVQKKEPSINQLYLVDSLLCRKLDTAQEMREELWRKRAKKMSYFLEKYPHINERLQNDRTWLIELVNIDWWWDTFERQTKANSVSGIEQHLDSFLLGQGTELRRKVDLAFAHTTAAEKYVADLARSVKDRVARRGAIGKVGDKVEPYPIHRWNEENTTYNYEKRVLVMLREKLRRAFINSLHTDPQSPLVDAYGRS